VVGTPIPSYVCISSVVGDTVSIEYYQVRVHGLIKALLMWALTILVWSMSSIILNNSLVRIFGYMLLIPTEAICGFVLMEFSLILAPVQ